jgi:hypothetical protein
LSFPVQRDSAEAWRFGALAALFFTLITFPGVTFVHEAMRQRGLPLSPLLAILPLCLLWAGLVTLEKRLKASPAWGRRVLNWWSLLALLAGMAGPAVVEIVYPLPIATSLPAGVPTVLAVLPLVAFFVLAGKFRPTK